jgi:hypothetical protein
MKGASKVSRIVLRVARRIAGAERRDWITAMEAETDAAGRHATQWALGCLYAAARDRLIRDSMFLIALLTLPVLALLIAVPLSLFAAVSAHRLGVPTLAIVPILLLGPLPAAWLLGRLRPSYSPVAVGTLGFLLHQAVPTIAMWSMTGRLPNFVAPNVTYYNMPASAGLAASWIVWVGATWWGAVAGRQASGDDRPEPLG